MRLRQFDARAVAPLESLFVHAHLLTLEFGRDASYKHDGFCIAYLCQKFLVGRRHLVLNVEAQEGEVAYLHVVYLHAVCLASLYLHLPLGALNAVAHVPDVYERVAIHDEAHLVVSVDVEDHRFVLRRRKRARQSG